MGSFYLWVLSPREMFQFPAPPLVGTALTTIGTTKSFTLPTGKKNMKGLVYNINFPIYLSKIGQKQDGKK